MITRSLQILLLALLLGVGAAPSTGQAQQQSSGDAVPPVVDRSKTGGATTLEDILRRQEGLKVDDGYRRENTGDPEQAPEITDTLGTRGGASDPDLWRAFRYGSADITTQSDSPAATVMIQQTGMWWLELRKGPLMHYGAYLLGATLVLLALFFLIRGRIRIDGEKTGRTITRFSAIERFGHWLLAGSFIVLAVTGLVVLFGRVAVIPLLGHEAFSPIAIGSKWVHNNISWAFMIGLVMVFVMWVLENIPSLLDLKWLAVGGGIFTRASTRRPRSSTPVRS